jgi:hypothetical protein
MLMGCKPELQRQYNNTVARLKGYQTLEPYEAKVSRTVHKGLETGNGLRLLNNKRGYQNGKHSQNGNKTLSGDSM